MSCRLQRMQLPPTVGHRIPRMFLGDFRNEGVDSDLVSVSIDELTRCEMELDAYPAPEYHFPFIVSAPRE